MQGKMYVSFISYFHEVLYIAPIVTHTIEIRIYLSLFSVYEDLKSQYENHVFGVQ